MSKQSVIKDTLQMQEKQTFQQFQLQAKPNHGYLISDETSSKEKEKKKEKKRKEKKRKEKEKEKEKKKKEKKRKEKKRKEKERKEKKRKEKEKEKEKEKKNTRAPPPNGTPHLRRAPFFANKDKNVIAPKIPVEIPRASGMAIGFTKSDILIRGARDIPLFEIII